MAITDVFSIQTQYLSLPMAFIVIVLVASIAEPASRASVLSVLGTTAAAIGARALVPAWVYDAFALVGALLPLLMGLGLVWVGMGLPQWTELILYTVVAVPLLIGASVAIPASGIRFTDSIVMDTHRRAAALAFFMIVFVGAATEPESLQSVLVMAGAVLTAILPIAVLPRRLNLSHARAQSHCIAGGALILWR